MKSLFGLLFPSHLFWKVFCLSFSKTEGFSRNNFLLKAYYALKLILYVIVLYTCELICVRMLIYILFSISYRDELIKPMGVRPDGTMAPLEEAVSQYHTNKQDSSDSD